MKVVLIVWLHLVFFVFAVNISTSAELRRNLNQIDLLLEEYRLQKALMLAESLHQNHSNVFPLQKQLFQIHLRLGSLDQAALLHEQITNRFQNRLVDYLTAQLFFTVGSLDDAEKTLKQILNDNPTHVSALLLLVEIHRERQHFHLLEKTLQKIRDIAPYHKNYLYENVAFLILQKYSEMPRQKWIREVERNLNDYYQKHSVDHHYFYLRALTSYRQDNHEDALKEIENVLILNPTPYYLSAYLECKLELLFLLGRWREFGVFLNYYRSYWTDRDIPYLEAMAQFLYLKSMRDEHYAENNLSTPSPSSYWKLLDSRESKQNSVPDLTESHLRQQVLFPLQKSIKSGDYGYNNFFYTALILENLPQRHPFRIEHANFLVKKLAFGNNEIIMPVYFQKALRLAPLNFDLRRQYLDHLLLDERYADALNEILLLKKLVYASAEISSTPLTANPSQGQNLESEKEYLQTLEKRIFQKTSGSISHKYDLNRLYLKTKRAGVLLLQPQTARQLHFALFPKLFHRELVAGLRADQKINLDLAPNSFSPQSSLPLSVNVRHHQVAVVCRYVFPHHLGHWQVSSFYNPIFVKNSRITFTPDSRDKLTVEIKIYSGETRLLLEKFTFIANEDHKIFNIIQHIKTKIHSHLQFYGEIVTKTPRGIIVDWGSRDEITEKSQFFYRDKTFTPTEVDEHFTLIEIFNADDLRSANIGDRVMIKL